MPAIIEAKNISQTFQKEGQPLKVLSQVDVAVNQSEFVCLIGPSGSGKSTLLRILLGLIKPTKGNVSFDQSIRKAMVFQNFGLFPWLNVEQNVGFGLRMRGVKGEQLGTKVQHYINEMGLTGFETNHPKELSGGMRQRVGIARALAVEPNVLFMDEPFSALDAFTARKLRDETLAIWAKSSMTVVMVTHLVEEAVEMADRIIVFTPIPGKVARVIKVDLPRPRNRRSQPFYSYVDLLERLIV